MLDLKGQLVALALLDREGLMDHLVLQVDREEQGPKVQLDQ